MRDIKKVRNNEDKKIEIFIKHKWKQGEKSKDRKREAIGKEQGEKRNEK